MQRHLTLVLLILTYSLLLTASDKASQEGKKLLERAELKANIFELPSFEMRAKVKIDDEGKPVDGSYTLLWNGPDQWREETSIPGYSEVKVGVKGVVSVKRSTNFIPLRIQQLYWALAYGRARLTPGPKETVKQIHGRNVNGVKVECAEIAGPESHKEICADISTGALVRQTPFLDKELVPFDTKLFPRFLSYIENGKTVAEAQVTELKTTGRLPSSAFEPPAGAVSRPGCMNPDHPGHLVKRVNPSYPEMERRSHVEGTVAIYAVIATDGALSELQIVSGVTPGLNKASLDAVQQWRYEPYTCNGVAIEVETVFLVNYTLSR
jgi:TonB family protein